MDIINWLRNKTNLYVLVAIYVGEFLTMILPYILRKITPNIGLIILWTWLPWYLNTLLFKTSKENSESK
jgi:hypothetical protein